MRWTSRRSIAAVLAYATASSECQCFGHFSGMLYMRFIAICVYLAAYNVDKASIFASRLADLRNVSLLSAAELIFFYFRAAASSIGGQSVLTVDDGGGRYDCAHTWLDDSSSEFVGGILGFLQRVWHVHRTVLST